MRNKNKMYLLLVLLIICFSVSISLVVYVKGTENYFTAIPINKSTDGISVEKIEELNENNFLTTYEVKKEEQVLALNSNHKVVVIGTNYVYSYITGYSIISGSFITQSAQEHERRFAVLNEPAAFELFGSYDIVGNNIVLQGKSYVVTGIINDEDSENKNVYIPITLINDKPTALITKIDGEQGITEEYIKNNFKELGVTESGYYFINFDRISKTIQEQASISMMIIVFVILNHMLKYNIKKFKTLVEVFKGLIIQYYFKEILQSKLNFVFKMIWRILCILFCMTGVLIIVFNNFKILINWDTDIKELIELNSDCFIYQIQYIRHIFIFSTIVFIFYFIILIVFLISFRNFKNVPS